VLFRVYPKFAVDGMLGKIAKKLRIFGFDTLYLADTDDDAIIKICSDGKRVFLTRDRELYNRSRKANIPCFLINLENELESLIAIMKEYDIGYILHVPNKNTRCTLCNGDLEIVSNSSPLADAVPKKVFESIDIFFKCMDCQKIYWSGKHVKEINCLVDEINKKIMT
jgi:uncharacterized protein with PIN domain